MLTEMREALNQRDHHAGLEQLRCERYFSFSQTPLKVTGSAKLIFEILKAGSGK